MYIFISNIQQWVTEAGKYIHIGSATNEVEIIPPPVLLWK